MSQGGSSHGSMVAPLCGLDFRVVLCQHFNMCGLGLRIRPITSSGAMNPKSPSNYPKNRRYLPAPPKEPNITDPILPILLSILGYWAIILGSFAGPGTQNQNDQSYQLQGLGEKDATGRLLRSTSVLVMTWFRLGVMTWFPSPPQGPTI